MPIKTTSPIVHNFAISIWFSMLFAVSFAGAIFGLFGTSAALAMLIMAFIASMVTLWFAYQQRATKNALKTPADAIAILGIVLFIPTLFESDLIVSLVELLFFLQLALNLYFREHRQVYFGLISCFVALMTGALYTHRTGFLLFIFLFCLCASFYLALCYVDKKLSLSDDLASTFEADATTHHAVSEDTAQTEHSAHISSQAYGQWTNLERIGVALGISLLTGMIYLLIPRFPAGNIGKLPVSGWGDYQNAAFEKQLLPETADLSNTFYNTPADEPVSQGTQPNTNTNQNHREQANNANGSSDGTGTSDSTSRQSSQNQLGDSSSQYARDGSVYFYVKSSRSRYLQMQVKTYFDGASWYALQYGRKRLREHQGLFWLYGGAPNATVDITVAQDIPTHIVTTDNALAVHFPSKNVGRDYYDNLKSGNTLKEGTFYQLHILDEYKHNRLIDSHQASPDARDLQLPKSLDPRIKQLAKSVTQHASSDWQKAVMLEQHLRHHYQYTLSTLWNQNNIPLTDFLFGKKTGHCEYFATAMAMMLRTQGIPARMVTGLVAEDYNPVTGFYEVKGTNAHAWVAAYVDGVWTVFEATGAYQPPQENPQDKSQNAKETSNTHHQLKDYLENLAKQDQQLSEINTKQSLTERISHSLREFWYALLLFLETIWQHIMALLKSTWMVWVLLPLVWLAWQRVSSAYLTRWQDMRDFRRLKRIKPQQYDHPKQLITESMAPIQSMLTRHGVIRHTGMTVEAFTAELSRQSLMSVAQTEQLIDIVNQHFYHNTPDEKNKTMPHPRTLTNKDIHAYFVSLFDTLQSSLSNKPTTAQDENKHI